MAAGFGAASRFRERADMSRAYSVKRQFDDQETSD